MSKTLQHIVFVIFSAVMGKLIGIMMSFLVARFLQPANYGIWVTLMLIPTYASIFCFGSVETLIKQYPNYIGRGEHAKAVAVENSVLSSVMLSAVGLIVFGSCFELLDSYSKWFSLDVSAYPVVVAAAVGLLTAFYSNRFVAHQNFKMVSVLDILRSLCSFSILVAFSWLWGLKGVVAGYTISELLICIFAAKLSWRLYGKGGLNFDPKQMWMTVRVGFPISIFWWIFIIQTSLDRVLSMALLGKTATGYYGLSISIVGAIVLIPQAISRVLYPKVNEMLGRNSGTSAIFETVILPARILSLLLPLMIGIVVIASPFVYQRLLPKYAPGLVSAQILFVGSFFRFCIGNGANFLIASDRQKSLLGYVSVSIIVGLITSMLLVRWNFNINGIALGTGISGAVLFFLVWRSVFKNMGYNVVEQRKELISLVMPFIVLLGILFVLRSLVFNFMDEPSLFFLRNAFLFFTLFCVTVFFIPPLNRHTREIYRLAMESFNRMTAHISTE
jgi:O-antigen/teichoic acid export membrane protein